MSTEQPQDGGITRLASRLYWATFMGAVWIMGHIGAPKRYALLVTDRKTGKATVLPARFDITEAAHRAAATSLIGELEYDVIET